MSKAKWNKLKNIYPILTEIIKRSKINITTNQILDILYKKHNIRIDWKTCNKYLKDLEEAKHIKHIKLNMGKNIYNFWTIKGVKKEDEPGNSKGT